MPEISAKLMLQLQTTGVAQVQAAAKQYWAVRSAATAAAKAANLSLKDASKGLAMENAMVAAKKRELTVENEMAKIQAQRQRKDIRAKAMETLDGRKRGWFGGFMQGHGFQNPVRAAVGGLRDIGGALFAVKYGFDLIAGSAMAAIDPVRHFEFALAQVKSKQNFSAEEMAAISDKSKEIGRTTMFSPTQAAEAAATMAAAGMHGHDIPGALNPTMQFAQATHISTEEAAHTFVEIGTQFNLGASKFTHIGDVLARASTSATASIDDFRESMKYVGPIANSMGFSLEFVTAQLAMLAEGGIKGSTAGTGLRSMMITLANPTKKAKDAIKQLHMSTKDMHNALASPSAFKAFLVNMDKAMNARHMDKASRTGLLAGMFGKIAAPVALESINAALKNGGKLWDGYIDKMNNADGHMQDVADTLGDTLEGKIQKFNASMETAKITVGEKFLPVLSRLMPKLAEAAVKTGDWTAANAKLLSMGGGGIAALFAGNMAWSGLVGAGGMLGKILPESSAITAAGSSFGVTFAAAVVAAVVGYGLATKILDATKDDQSGMNIMEQFGAWAYGAQNGGDVEHSTTRGMDPRDQVNDGVDEIQKKFGPDSTPQFNAVTGQIEIKVTDERVRVTSKSKGPVGLRTGSNPSAPTPFGSPL